MMIQTVHLQFREKFIHLAAWLAQRLLVDNAPPVLRAAWKLQSAVWVRGTLVACWTAGDQLSSCATFEITLQKKIQVEVFHSVYSSSDMLHAI
jgi:hypothetical protein